MVTRLSKQKRQPAAKLRHLVVASDDDDADARFAAIPDCINHLNTRRIEHADNTDKCTVCLQTTSIDYV